MVQAFYQTNRGSSIRPAPTLAEAEKILQGKYGAKEVTLKMDGEIIVGQRFKRGGKWMWWVNVDVFQDNGKNKGGKNNEDSN
jgi:hypothetical protein